MSWLHELIAGGGVGLVAGLASGFTGTMIALVSLMARYMTYKAQS